MVEGAVCDGDNGICGCIDGGDGDVKHGGCDVAGVLNVNGRLLDSVLMAVVIGLIPATVVVSDGFVAAIDDCVLVISSIPGGTPNLNTPGFTTVLLSTGGGDGSTGTGSRSVIKPVPVTGCGCGELGWFDTGTVSEIGVAGSLSEFSSLRSDLMDCWSAGLGISSFSDMLPDSLVASSSSAHGPPCACDWWYFKPFICLYFLQQFASGHSKNTGDEGGLAGVVCEVVLLFLPFACGDADSSSEGLLLRLLPPESGLGGTNGVGEFDKPLRVLLLEPLLLLLSLLWTDDRVSVKLLKSFVAARPRFARPFGKRASKSLVGESQNLTNKAKRYKPFDNFPMFIFTINYVIRAPIDRHKSNFYPRLCTRLFAFTRQRTSQRSLLNSNQPAGKWKLAATSNTHKIYTSDATFNHPFPHANHFRALKLFPKLKETSVSLALRQFAVSFSLAGILRNKWL